MDLLHESGMEDCNDWLTLLQDAEVNRDVLERVALHISRRESGAGERVEINDSTVTSAVALLPLIPRKKVRIDIHRRETTTTDLILALNNHSLTWLHLWHHYKEPTLPPASVSLLEAMPR